MADIHKILSNSGPYIANDGSLGIGTDSPGAKFDIKGDTTTWGGMAKIFLTDTASSASSRNFSIGNGGSGFGHLSFIVSNAKNGVPADSTGTSIMVLDGVSKLVGIGTTTPGAKLEIKAASAQEGIKIRNVNSQDTFHLGHLSSEDPYFQMKNNAGTTELVFRCDNGNNYINTGNLGIGTTTPGQKLHVEGALRVSSGADRKIDFLRTGGNHFSIEHDTAQIYFYNHTTSESPILMQNDGDVIMNAGNIGVNTSSPQYRLDVNQGASSTAGVVIPLRVSGGTMSASGDGTAILLTNRHSAVTGGDYGAYMRIVSTQGSPSYLNPRLEFGVQNNNTNAISDVGTKMTILGSGNVGIGTIDPASILHIKTTDDSTINQGLVIERSANSDRGYINYQGGGFQFRSTGGDPLVFGDLSNEHMRILSSGNVGIGTTSPNEKFVVGTTGGTQNIEIGTNFIQSFNRSASPGYQHLNFYASGYTFNNGNVTFAGNVAISNTSGDTLTLTKSTTEPSLRIEGDTDKDFVITVSGELLTFTQNDGATDILTLDHDTKNATFGGVLDVNGASASTFYALQLARSGTGTTTPDIWGENNTLVIGTSSSTEVISLNGSNATFAGSISSGDITIEDATPALVLKDSNNGAGGAAQARVLFSNTGGKSIGIGTMGTDDTSTDLYISSNAGSTYGGYLLLDADGITDAQADIIIDPKTSFKVFTAGTLALTLDTSQIPTFQNATASGTAMYIYNTTNSVANTKTLIDFRARASDNSAFYVSGQIGSKAEGTWTSTSSTRDASLIFNTVLNGNNELALTLASNKTATFAGAVRVSTLSYGDPSDDSPLGALSYGSDFVTLETNGAFPIQLKTNGTTAITIDTSQNALFAGDIQIDDNLFVNYDYDTDNRYLFLRKHQSNDGGIVMQSKTSGGSTQSDWQILNHGGTGDLKFYAYGLGAHALTLDRENGNATFAGNVGIGTTSPQASLHVAGAISSAPSGTGVLMGMESNFSIVHLNGASGGIIDFSTSGVDRKGRILYNHASNYMQIETNGSERMRITSDGKVGIGMNNPWTNLVVSGSGSSTTLGPNASYRLCLTNTDQTNNNYSLISFNDGATEGGSAAIGCQYIDHANNYGELVFATRDSGGFAERMRVTSGGKVGIGTTAPGRKLTVTGDVSGDANNLLIANENDTDGDSASIGFSMLSNDTYVKAGIFFKRTTTQGRGDLIFATNDEVNGNNVSLSNARMTINRSGNIGIGVTSPSYRLDINSSDSGLRIVGTTRSQILLSNGTSAWQIESPTSSGNVPAGAFGIIESGVGSRFTILTGGNVGIGTTSPSYLLEVGSATQTNSNVFSGRVNGDFIFNLSKANTNLFSIRNNSTGVVHLNTQNSADLALGVSTGAGTGSIVSNLTINSAGNVGIGTGSPYAVGAAWTTLDVEGKASGGGGIVYAACNGRSVVSHYYSSTTKGYVGTQTNHDFVITSNNADRMVVNSSGNVTVGGTSAYGGTGVTSLNIQAGDYPTLAFYKDTTLRTTMISYSNSHLFSHSHASAKFTFQNGTATQGELSGTGTFTVKGDVVAFGSPSDISLKENIKPIESALDKVEKLQGVTFNWKEQGITDLKEDIGFIAQDVQEVLPELVRENDNGKLSLRDKGIVPVLVEAIKELKAEIEELKKCECKNCNCK